MVVGLFLPSAALHGERVQRQPSLRSACFLHHVSRPMLAQASAVLAATQNQTSSEPLVVLIPTLLPLLVVVSRLSFPC